MAGEADRMPMLADRWAATPPPDLGALDAARAVIDALAALTRALVADLDAAGARLREAARAPRDGAPRPRDRGREHRAAAPVGG